MMGHRGSRRRTHESAATTSTKESRRECHRIRTMCRVYSRTSRRAEAFFLDSNGPREDKMLPVLQQQPPM
ncbi:hypothetical protein HPB49_022538 [Dermacentor silvarum]|uniref:Uncharacterized protein n=1 Tax=Dermacentor silvarum TaxID=543639 RepID=A0ACB8CBP2_DERSI|nr:hypothetical protein HPB49_022538 [Dermacentor silvarum]